MNKYQFNHFYILVIFTVVAIQASLHPQKLIAGPDGDPLTISFQSNSGDVQGTVIANPSSFESGTDTGNGTRYLLPIADMVFTKDGNRFPVLVGGVTITDRNGIETISVSATGFGGATVGMRASVIGGNFFSGENLPDAESLANFFILAEVQVFCGPETVLGKANVEGQDPTGGVSFSPNPLVHQVIVPFKVFEVVSGQNATEQDLTLDFEVGNDQFKFFAVNQDGSIGDEIKELGIPAGDAFEFASSFQPQALEQDASLTLEVEVKVKENDEVSLEIVGTNVYAPEDELTDPSSIGDQVFLTAISQGLSKDVKTQLGVSFDFAQVEEPGTQFFYSLKLPEGVTVEAQVVPKSARCEQEKEFENFAIHPAFEALGDSETLYQNYCHFLENPEVQPKYDFTIEDSVEELDFDLTIFKLFEDGTASRLRPYRGSITVIPINQDLLVGEVSPYQPVNLSLKVDEQLDVDPRLDDFEDIDEEFGDDFGIVCNFPGEFGFSSQGRLKKGQSIAVLENNDLIAFDGKGNHVIDFIKNNVDKNGFIENGHPYQAYVFDLNPGEVNPVRFINDTGKDVEFSFVFFKPELHFQSSFLPGDCNQDSQLNMTDAICLLSHLFLGEPNRLPCGGGLIDDPANVAVLDLNGQAGTDTSDAIYLLVHLFIGGPGPVQGIECITVSDCPDTCGN